MTIGIGEEKKSTLVFYIKLVTSEGRVLEAGTPSPTMIVFEAPPGKHIVSFHGRSGKAIDKLGPIFAPDFGGS
ncbi:MAG: hypothetical protein EOP07_05835 [Proteobacteria bacterium]|nr:MAG: hypothetical protein EOP07_05835 [Pseudomonadota bacterium]